VVRSVDQRKIFCVAVSVTIDDRFALSSQRGVIDFLRSDRNVLPIFYIGIPPETSCKCLLFALIVKTVMLSLLSSVTKYIGKLSADADYVLYGVRSNHDVSSSLQQLRLLTLRTTTIGLVHSSNGLQSSHVTI
jgi:hypothetical protein